MDISESERLYQQKIIDNIRLKKLFINYIIPYSERGYKIDEEGNESRVLQKDLLFLLLVTTTFNRQIYQEVFF